MRITINQVSLFALLPVGLYTNNTEYTTYCSRDKVEKKILCIVSPDSVKLSIEQVISKAVALIVPGQR